MAFLGPECLGVATLLPPHPLTVWGAALSPSDPGLAGAHIAAHGRCFGPAPEWMGALSIGTTRAASCHMQHPGCPYLTTVCQLGLASAW